MLATPMATQGRCGHGDGGDRCTDEGAGRAWLPFTESEAKLARQVGYLSRMYAVVVTNPPYMGGKNMDATLAAFAKDNYPTTKSDLFAMFIERCLALATVGGQVAMITMQSWMFLSSYEKLRHQMLAHSTISTMAHLGARAFDSIGGEVVQSTAFVLAKGWVNGEGIFIRLVGGGNEAEKASSLRKAAGDPADVGRHQVNGLAFEAIPGTPIVYWLSEKMRAAFAKGRSLGDMAAPRKGIDTGENDCFLRLWFEPSSYARARTWAEGAKWYPYNKGGDFRRWYGNREWVVNWGQGGRDIASRLTWPRKKSTIRNRDYFGLEGLCWTTVSSGQFSVRYSSPGALFDNGGCTLFSTEHDSLLGFGGLLNSTFTQTVLAALAPTLNYQPGDIAAIPVVCTKGRAAKNSRELVSTLIACSKLDWDDFETSSDFETSGTLAIFRSMRE